MFCTQVPPHGLVLHTGTILAKEGKERKLSTNPSNSL